jgi:hypothetical protein
MCTLLISLSLGLHSPAAAETISGRATATPWSGYWWPMLNTYTYKLYNSPGPMTRYDAYSRATGRTVGAYRWEYGNHRTTDAANDWWGHCHAWSAAAMMEPQPYGTTKAGVYFSQDDAEGLYSETYHRIVGWMYGTQYSTGGSSEAYRDVYPVHFDNMVRYWIGQQKVPLMMDFDPGNQVWNYPVYAFSRSSTWSGNKEYVTMKLTNARPYYGYNGTASQTRTFYYTLQSGTNGSWSNPSGSSVNTHPDYIIHIDGRASDYGNPYVKPAVLDGIFRPTAAPAARPAVSTAVAPSEGSARQRPPANRLGWRLGTEWTVKVREYATYLYEPSWIATEYRFEVVRADPTTRSFTVRVRFADPGLQPMSARGDRLKAGYTVVNGTPRLTWVQPLGKGPKMAAREAEGLLGQNWFSLNLPADPFGAGSAVGADVPGLGKVRANRVNLGTNETATFAKGAPWWVSYSKGARLSVELTGFEH